ncbi:hypothetical protein M430DRAFT_265274 [Amorphotheca resinae ATCC 22711]|jgi:hypothetical protein|uniref:Uncharacterized protein n=1 Tax=Amorphotheca resinae ATCC 22711 TaxID=857342 RepID=A0A2T3AWQ9_AMORE|nr:hypothetical protein M430DRAFT_265274 [Amorphotheca resinae ATCC 22711]PSS13117.1 hypothetical protein M430DRAFT_265274 [Amorphotheca resinae ATCC 22711]
MDQGQPSEKSGRDRWRGALCLGNRRRRPAHWGIFGLLLASGTTDHCALTSLVIGRLGKMISAGSGVGHVVFEKEISC